MWLNSKRAKFPYNDQDIFIEINPADLNQDVEINDFQCLDEQGINDVNSHIYFFQNQWIVFFVFYYFFISPIDIISFHDFCV